MSRKVEYYGINHNGSSVVNEKTYYFYDGEELPSLPPDISQWLAPFDISDRSDSKIGISYFVKNTGNEALYRLATFLTESIGIQEFEPSSFLCDFKSLSHIGEGTHYDPVVSIKLFNGDINEVSFYVNTVPNKSLCTQYWNEVKQYLNPEPDIIDIIEGLMISGAAIMYLFSWDFDATGCYQNKIYVKVKDSHLFKSRICKTFPTLMSFLEKENYRLTDFAFAMRTGKIVQFNIYFKPL